MISPINGDVRTTAPHSPLMRPSLGRGTKRLSGTKSGRENICKTAMLCPSAFGGAAKVCSLASMTPGTQSPNRLTTLAVSRKVRRSYTKSRQTMLGASPQPTLILRKMIATSVGCYHRVTLFGDHKTPFLRLQSHESGRSLLMSIESVGLLAATSTIDHAAWVARKQNQALIHAAN